MVWPMSSASLTAVSYLVLGLVARAGNATPYDLKRFVARSIGYFWPFPHSQLYAEPARLAAAGLLAEERESGGRHRRTYSITDDGLSALRAWLREPVDHPPQYRDLGLLKLFFGELVDTEDVVALARGQEAAHRRPLAELAEIDARLATRADVAHPHATLRLGLLMERAFIEFWSDLAESPPLAADAAQQRRD